MLETTNLLAWMQNALKRLDSVEERISDFEDTWLGTSQTILIVREKKTEGNKKYSRRVRQLQMV
jgi:hypothetical protein